MAQRTVPAQGPAEVTAELTYRLEVEAVEGTRAKLKATVSGAVFMCAFTTKTAVYALARGLAGLDIPIPYNRNLELHAVPQVEDIVAKARDIVKVKV